MATVVFQATPGGIDVDGEEEIRLRRRAQLYIDDNGLDSTGELVISTKRIAWQAEGAQQGFSLAYQSIVMHAVSRDTSCLLYTSPSPRDRQKSRMPSSA